MLTSISRSSLRQVLLRSMTASERPMVVSSRFHDQLGFPGLLSGKMKNALVSYGQYNTMKNHQTRFPLI